MKKKSINDLNPEQLKQLLSIGKEDQEQPDSSKAQTQDDPEVTASMFMDKTGSRIGPFRIEKELGRGGAGVVYLAHDTKLDRQVAIKSLPPELANNEKFQARFQREAKLLASLNHPNIATIHDELEEAHGQKFLVLEYIPGETLREKIAKGAMELKQALAIAVDITDAIAAAHEKGVIHRDIKPENIKITPDGRTKLLDFGIARMMSTASITASTLTESGHIVGTIGYMSPEQARGKSADHRTDIWAIGCILYEMVTSHCAFSGETGTDILASILKTDPDWKELPTDTDASVRSIIEKCLEKDADERYQSAEELLAELQECRKSLMTPAPKPIDTKAITALLHRPKIAVGVLLVLFMVIAGIGWGIHRSIKIKWANEIAIPEITDLVREARYFEAFQLAQKAQEYIPNNPMLDRLLLEMTRSCSIRTNPSGAKLAYKEYSDLDGEWIELGYSPADFKLPFGAYRWLITKPGYVPLEFASIGVTSTSGEYDPIAMEIELYEEANSEPGMVLIEMPAYSHKYWMDKYEVTNEKFQKFVDAGGYQDQKYWEHKFIDEEGRELSFQEAMERFRDRSLRPGPATWVGGTFPEGQDRYPVSGVSWYEAAAYAEFAGKSLPTVRHWFRAARYNFDASMFIPYSNFDGLDLEPVGASGALCSTGVYDMAGNVREWCYNAADDSGSRCYILGGGWQQQSYVFALREKQSPWNREEINGFRCVKYPGDIELIAELFDPIEPVDVVDFRDIEAIPDEELDRLIKEHYIYKPANAEELDIKEEEPDTESSPFWSKQKITYNAAYGGERVIAYLFLPKGVDSKYQPVIYFPGAGVVRQDSSNELTTFEFGIVDFMLKSGRAVLYPVYKGTFERKYPEDYPGGDGPFRSIDFDPNNPSHLVANRERKIQPVMDLRRSVDYLMTRTDMNMPKLTYCGFSWGTIISPIILSLEDRIKFAILISGGFGGQNVLPAACPVNFAPRVRCDVLMISGLYDPVFPLKTSQEPSFEMLGKLYEDTADEIDKKLWPYPGGHSTLLHTNAREDILTWMNDPNHLGPVD